MQELFVDKIYFFKFLFVSDKSWLDELKIVTLLLLVVRGFSWKDSVPSLQGRENTNKAQGALPQKPICDSKVTGHHFPG